LFYSAADRSTRNCPSNCRPTASCRFTVRPGPRCRADCDSSGDDQHRSVAPGIFTTLLSGWETAYPHGDTPDQRCQSARAASKWWSTTLVSDPRPIIPSGQPATSINDTEPGDGHDRGKNGSGRLQRTDCGPGWTHQVNMIVPTGLSGSQQIQVTAGQGNPSPLGVNHSVTP